MSETLAPSTITVRLADYADAVDAARVVALLDSYARDPMGGGKPLAADVRERLVPGLAAHGGAFSLLAFAKGVGGAEAVGLANCITGYSTFAGRPLVNIHDMAVLPAARGRGVGRALMLAVEDEARRRGACKVTLEVLSGNTAARALYASLGYGDYALDPEAGTALFWDKKL